MKLKYRTPIFYDEFKCIGGICEDSCCENWEIDLDDASLKSYMKQGGEFGKRLHKNTKVKEKQFILNGTRCPFLNDDNLCDIYIEMGEDCLCETCTNFPRHIEEFDHLKEVSLTMSCPEASRIMLAKKEKMEFVCKEGKDEDYGLKPIKPVKNFVFWKRKHVNKLDCSLFDYLFEARKLIFEILQNREKSISNRAAIVLCFSEKLQNEIDANQYHKIEDLISQFRDVNYIAEVERTLIEYDGRIEKKEFWLKQILNMYEGLETIKEEWDALLSLAINALHLEEKEDSQFLNHYELLYKEFESYHSVREYEYEHILVYYIFNYFLGAAYDHDAYTKVKFAIVSYLVILELDLATWLKNKKKFLYEDQVFVAHAYSKEVEHSYNNFESLQLVLSAHPILNKENILCALIASNL